MYETGYNKIFWGLIFTIVNINLGPIDILPNFIGYLLILSGLSIVEGQHVIYKKGRLPAIILSILSLKDFFTANQGNILTGQAAPLNLGLMLLGALVNLIGIYLIYVVCKGIYLVSSERGIQDLSDNAKGSFKFYFILNLIILFYMPFSLNLGQDAGALTGIFFILVILNLFAVIGIALVFRRGRDTLME